MKVKVVDRLNQLAAILNGTCVKDHINSVISSFLLVLIAGLPLSTAADDLEQSQNQLDQIAEDLKSLQQSLSGIQSEASEQRKALKSVETEFGRIQTEVSQLAKNLALHQAELQRLNEQKIVLTDRLKGKEKDIQAILRLAYKQNNQPLIKLILSGERPENLSRHLYYFSVLTENQQQKLAVWLQEQAELNSTMLAQEQTIATIESQTLELAKRQQSLKVQKNKRAQILTDLVQQAKSTDAEIKRKEAERKKMTELVVQLAARLEALSLEFPDADRIDEIQGKLPWPVDGRLTNRYGRSIDGSALKWQGWLISAADGQAVKAVHGGRIIFADFFKSNGLLIIIDHGNGIWTLYGRNQAILKGVGSWVDAGEVIAEVGRSGGYQQSGLYFEVRKKGEPQNPERWLQKR